MPTQSDIYDYHIYASGVARIANASTGQTITAGGYGSGSGQNWNSVVWYVNQEIARRNPSGKAVTNASQVSASTSPTGSVNAADFNNVNNIMATLPLPDHGSATPFSPGTWYGYYGNGVQANFSYGGPLVANVAQGTLVQASLVNNLIAAIYAASQVCLCNCNYCTCNCNYCTCNCNYSCTCNCNYSDERLKTNIIFERQESGINLYTWSYIWDKTTTYLGVLAHELLGTKYESALSKDKNGFYMVDYTKLPVSMTTV